jgi:hypothetical protein
MRQPCAVVSNSGTAWRCGDSRVDRLIGYSFQLAGKPPSAPLMEGELGIRGSILRSEEEFGAWQRAFAIYDVKGLHAALLQQRRDDLYPPTTKPISPTESSPQQGFSTHVTNDLEGSLVHASSLPEKGLSAHRPIRL